MPRISHGRGSYLWDTDGRQYIDGSCGPAVYCIGHADPRVNRAVAEQMDRVAHGYRFSFTSDPLEEMTDRVARAMGADLSEMVFVTGGSEAVESAIKIALQYHFERGEPQRTRFIARHRSWHGNTLMATALSGFEARRRPFEGALPAVGRVSAANAYRPPEGVGENALVPHLVAELRAEIERIGPDRVAAFIFEPVVGAAGGAVPAPEGYAKAVTDLCHANGILVISDEVMCGAGRCGAWRASQVDGIVPDIVTTAKGLSGGYLPLGAAVYTRRIGDVFRAGSGAPLTAHTYSGHTACLAAGVAVQRIIEEEGLVAHVAGRAPRWIADLRQRLAPVEAVGDVRGRGYFIGIELVRDRETKAPFDPNLRLAERVRSEAMARGLICYPSSGNADGNAGDHVILAPPLNATDAELDEIAAKTEATLRAVLARIATV
ncbi:MAG: aminotransferase class III-fold pyridoxal phosphate-dependent enzyme [Rhodobacteraceae bacterium]|nr:MAG: aminotransferase class III-fold pyridoxal phosphate-dependent enzyme [Paracoccaceae bacterium]